jgi:hypothetical protein
MEAVINLFISAFAFQRTWMYIRDPENARDLWWYTNAFILALSIFSIFINGYTLRKLTDVPVPPPPRAVPVVSLNDQARAATQKAVALTQQAHLQ